MNEAALKREFAATIRAKAATTRVASHRDVLLSLAQMIAPVAANDNAGPSS
jgi:hypothetical protein